MRLLLFFIFFTSFFLGQQKPIVFYDRVGEKISEQKFIDSKDYSKYLDLYFENDTTQIGILIDKIKFGQLNKDTFAKVKTYLTQLSKKPIDSTQNIVINYLTALPEIPDNLKSRSYWNILDRDYLKKLHKIANINQFYINSPECNNLNYYHQKKIQWLSDKENLFQKLFFPYQIKYGNYILIKPDGKFYYFLGEHSKYNVWEKSKEFFK